MTGERTKADAKARRKTGGPRLDVQLVVKTQKRHLSSINLCDDIKAVRCFLGRTVNSWLYMSSL